MHHRTSLAVLAVASLALVAGCASPAPEPAAPTEDPTAGSEYHLDPAEERISEAGALAITELWEAAQAAGERELVLQAGGIGEDIGPAIDAFTTAFPGVQVTTQNMLGGALTTFLESEKASGNHTADVFINPNLQLYLDYLEPYEVVSFEIPATLQSSAGEIIGPDHAWTSPYMTFFGLGIFQPRAGQAPVPTEWSDLADPAYGGGVLGMADPTLPGPGLESLLYWLENGALTKDDIATIIGQATVRGAFGETVAGLMQGEYAFMIGAPPATVLKAAASGAPVEFTLMDSGNHVNLVKQGVLNRSPNPNLARLFLEWMNTRTAQEAIASVGMTPLSLDAADPALPWTSWERANITEIVPASEIDANRAENMAWLALVR